jgi:pSer/pThr/pTyr-binding forkhead associated (FHA) protein
VSALELEIVEGPGAGQAVPLTTGLEIGTGAGAGLRLEDPHVSPAHARVSPADGGALVEDLGEPGGTFVNESELHAPTLIKPGDEIQVGVTVLQLRAGAPAARPAPPPLAAPQREPDLVPPEVLEQEPSTETLDALLDATTKTKARVAPLAIFVLVVFAVLIFLATAKL